MPGEWCHHIVNSSELMKIEEYRDIIPSLVAGSLDFGKIKLTGKNNFPSGRYACDEVLYTYLIEMLKQGKLLADDIDRSELRILLMGYYDNKQYDMIPGLLKFVKLLG